MFIKVSNLYILGKSQWQGSNGGLWLPTCTVYVTNLQYCVRKDGDSHFVDSKSRLAKVVHITRLYKAAQGLWMV